MPYIFAVTEEDVDSMLDDFGVSLGTATKRALYEWVGDRFENHLQEDLSDAVSDFLDEEATKTVRRLKFPW